MEGDADEAVKTRVVAVIDGRVGAQQQPEGRRERARLSGAL